MRIRRSLQYKLDKSKKLDSLLIRLAFGRSFSTLFSALKLLRMPFPLRSFTEHPPLPCRLFSLS